MIVPEKVSPFADSSLLRSCKTSKDYPSIQRQFVTYLSFISVDHPSHSLHINTIVHNTLEARFELLAESVQVLHGHRSNINRQVNVGGTGILGKVDVRTVETDVAWVHF